ncbi:hypothetical protein [Candidatus Nitrotoga sp. BS]|uniref:hypothetical protein n=1 Tax=Candidatus Nitrotoga sp. BS TaxID=2890408 RepID=UPI001EF1F7C5|nr:hypothetical protein [Candidatus Nitrotoga sp. BS]
MEKPSNVLEGYTQFRFNYTSELTFSFDAKLAVQHVGDTSRPTDAFISRTICPRICI